MESNLRVMVPVVVTDAEVVSVCVVTVPAVLQDSGKGWSRVQVQIQTDNKHQDTFSCCVKEELLVVGEKPLDNRFSDIAEVEDFVTSKLEKLALKVGVDDACLEFVDPPLPKMSTKAWDYMSAVKRTTVTFADLNLMEMLAFAATDMQKWEDLNRAGPLHINA